MIRAQPCHCCDLLHVKAGSDDGYRSRRKLNKYHSNLFLGVALSLQLTTRFYFKAVWST